MSAGSGVMLAKACTDEMHRPVSTGIGRGTTGLFWVVSKIFEIITRWTGMSKEECGERHVWLATSERLEGREDGSSSEATEVERARGIDGKIGSGVYSVDQVGESADGKVEEVVAGLIKDGTQQLIWNDAMKEYVRVVGKA